jgi:SRSO17 transposase
MDVELQILKHLARDAHPTVAIIDEYCAEYKDLFKEVRNYECFKYLHVGIMSPIKRKLLPEIALICRHKLSTVITSFYCQFRLVS